MPHQKIDESLKYENVKEVYSFHIKHIEYIQPNEHEPPICVIMYVGSEVDGEHISRRIEFHPKNPNSKELLVCIEGKTADDKTQWIHTMNEHNIDIPLLLIEPVGQDMPSRFQECYFGGTLHENFLQCIEECIDYIQSEFERNFDHITSMGFSLSANVALNLLIQRKKVQSIIAISPSLWLHNRPALESEKDFTLSFPGNVETKDSYMEKREKHLKNLQFQTLDHLNRVFLSALSSEFLTSYQDFELMAKYFQCDKEIRKEEIQKWIDKPKVSYVEFNEKHILYKIMMEIMYNGTQAKHVLERGNLLVQTHNGEHDWESWKNEVEAGLLWMYSKK